MGQAAQLSSLCLDAFEVACVLAADNLVNEAAISAKIIEVGRAAHQQCIVDGTFEMTVSTFDRAVLVGDAAVVASRFHPVVRTQCIVARGQILTRGMIQIAERGRQAVAAMLAWRTPDRPQRVLQPFGESDIALAAQDDMGVLEAGVDQAEVIEPMVQCNACDLHTQVPPSR